MSGVHHRWRRFRKCFGLYYDEFAFKGLCLAGGGHIAASLPSYGEASYNYYLTYDFPEQQYAPKKLEVLLQVFGFIL